MIGVSTGKISDQAGASWTSVSPSWETKKVSVHTEATGMWAPPKLNTIAWTTAIVLEGKMVYRFANEATGETIEVVLKQGHWVSWGPNITHTWTVLIPALAIDFRGPKEGDKSLGVPDSLVLAMEA